MARERSRRKCRCAKLSAQSYPLHVTTLMQQGDLFSSVDSLTILFSPLTVTVLISCSLGNTTVSQQSYNANSLKTCSQYLFFFLWMVKSGRWAIRHFYASASFLLLCFHCVRLNDSLKSERTKPDLWKLASGNFLTLALNTSVCLISQLNYDKSNIWLKLKKGKWVLIIVNTLSTGAKSA